MLNFQRIPVTDKKVFRKLILCKSCGARVEVKNFNRKLCSRCGHRAR
jgi:hypothetical protein